MHKHRMGRLSAVRKNNAGPKITKKRPVGRFFITFVQYRIQSRRAFNLTF